MGRVARLLVFWTRPAHLSVEEAETWIRAELSVLAAIDVIGRAELSRLESASVRLPRPCDWMLELHLVPGADRDACLAARPFREWLADLRLLGMHPSAVLADGALVVFEGREG
jgi:hypothetical protein